MSGSIVYQAEIIHDYIVLGDNEDNKKINGILSFNIDELGGESVSSARLEVTAIWNTPGDASEIGPLIIERCETRHEDRLAREDFSGGTTTVINGFDTAGGLYNINYSGDSLRNAIQNAIDEGKDYFQIRLGIVGTASMDDGSDQLQFDFSNVSLVVEY